MLAKLEQLLEVILKPFRLAQTPVGRQFPGLLAQRAVRFLQVTAHLRQGPFLAAKGHGERAGEFLVLLAEPGLLGFQRDIFRAKQLHLQPRVAVENEPALLRQLGGEADAADKSPPA